MDTAIKIIEFLLQNNESKLKVKMNFVSSFFLYWSEKHVILETRRWWAKYFFYSFHISAFFGIWRRFEKFFGVQRKKTSVAQYNVRSMFAFYGWVPVTMSSPSDRGCGTTPSTKRERMWIGVRVWFLNILCCSIFSFYSSTYVCWKAERGACNT